MKLKDLKSVLWSSRGGICETIVYDYDSNQDLEFGCSVEYAVKKYAEKEVRRIEAQDNFLVITI